MLFGNLDDHSQLARCHMAVRSCMTEDLKSILVERDGRFLGCGTRCRVTSLKMDGSRLVADPWRIVWLIPAKDEANQHGGVMVEMSDGVKGGR